MDKQPPIAAPAGESGPTTSEEHVPDGVDLKPEVDRLARRLQQLEAKLNESRRLWKSKRAAMKELNTARRRQILSADLVHDLLPVRHQTIPARAAYIGAHAAEARFAAAAEPYREALPGSAPADGLVRTDVQGLTWWVPVPRSMSRAARDRFVAKQRFPYRAIMQTREFAVGAILLDIGAHTGQMSIPRVILGDVAQAYCAEPDPHNYAALVRNVVDNGLRGLVLPDRVAIGASTGTAQLRHAKYPGGHHLVREDGTGDVSVPCCRLDDWCERLSIDPSLVTYVKVDTQGWETHVLAGAPRLLAHRHIAWQLEICPELLEGSGSSAVELYRMCADVFSHFVDLAKAAKGSRVRPIRELAEALEYLGRSVPHTDVICFNGVHRI